MSGAVSVEAPDDKTHLELLVESDRAFIDEIYARGLVDPGVRTSEQLSTLNERDLMRYRMQRTRYLQMIPLIETPIAESVMERLTIIAATAIRSKLHQQDVVIVDGEPGVGKTMLIKTHVAQELKRLALLRSIEIEDGSAPPVVVFRPVIYIHLRGPSTKHDLARLFLEELGWPANRDWTAVFARARHRVDLQLIVFDEIQHVNFDGRNGRAVHDYIRSLSNSGLRIVLAGTAVDWVLNASGDPAIEVAARNSRARWIVVEARKMEYETAEDRQVWHAVIDVFADRLRLARQPENPHWLADDFGAYLWDRTLGYFNSLVALINHAASRAIELGHERIDLQILEEVTIEYEVERQRTQRKALRATAERRRG